MVWGLKWKPYPHGRETPATQIYAGVGSLAVISFGAAAFGALRFIDPPRTSIVLTPPPDPVAVQALALSVIAAILAIGIYYRVRLVAFLAGLGAIAALVVIFFTPDTPLRGAAKGVGLLLFGVLWGVVGVFGYHYPARGSGRRT